MVLIKKLYLLFFVLSVFACSTNQSEQVSEEITQETNPKALYTLHCESCHGMDGKKKLSNAADLSKSIITSKKIKMTILNGNNKGMMPYRDVITSETEIDSLVEFVKKLRK